MKLTDLVDELFVPEAKLTQYLLNEAHATGQAKARFFLGAGFQLADALETLARHQEITDLDQRDYGVAYGSEGHINTPDGSDAPDSNMIRTIWIVKQEERIARFVTACSRRKKR